MWPELITHEFDRLSADTSRFSYYGPWNCILCRCFNLIDGYLVHPHQRVGLDRKENDSVDTVVSFIVQNNNNEAAILFVDINAPAGLAGSWERQDADAHMRKRFVQLYEQSASIMYGVSVFGRNFRIYCLDKETGKIAPPSATQGFPDDRVPQALWAKDVCEPDGYRTFMELVSLAKEAGSRS